MFSRIIKILTLFLIIAVVTAIWFFFGVKNTRKIKENSSSSISFSPTSGSKSEKTNFNSSISASSLASSVSALAQTEKYENLQYGFSFNYPTGFKVSEFLEDESKNSVIIKNTKTNQTIQIYVTSYNDPNFAVSAERIKRDIPDLPFSDSADVIVGKKAKGAAFFSEDGAFGGQTAEVWFADGRNFYQATAYRKDVKILEEIIRSWKFR